MLELTPKLYHINQHVIAFSARRAADQLGEYLQGSERANLNHRAARSAVHAARERRKTYVQFLFCRVIYCDMLKQVSLSYEMHLVTNVVLAFRFR